MCRTSLGIALAGILCVATSARAAVEYRDVGDLTVQAHQIVIGDVVEVTSFVEPPADGGEGMGLIRSEIVVEVSDYLVGTGTGTETMVMSGGTVGELTLRVSVLPVFEVGDHVLLFLNDNEIRLVESFQGAYLTDGELIARMAPACGEIIAESLQPLPDFLEEIEQALGAPLPEVTPYGGTFELPLNVPRYGLCGYDWTYRANPMGEDYKINPNCADGSAGSTSDQITQIQNGTAAWNNAGADFQFTYGGTSSQTAVNYNGTNLYYFDTTPPDGGGYIAANFFWTTGGNITENDIVFNDAGYSWWNGQGSCFAAMDIWNIATHESGHSLCLSDLYGGSHSNKTMYGYASTCETKKRTLHSDDIDGIVAIYGVGSGDYDPPTPDPMTFASVPAPVSDSSISMTATTATDAESPPVEYRFDFISGGAGGTDSDWQLSTTYTDDGLVANTAYTYAVRARDSASSPNATAWSSNETAVTYIETPDGLYSIAQTSSSIILILAGSVSNLTTGSSGIYFDSTTAGGDGGINQWIQVEDDMATGLAPDTLYTFRVKARNQNGVETGWGPSSSAATLANLPGAPTLTNATYATMDLNVGPNGNPGYTLFAIQCTATNPVDAVWNGQYVDASGQPSAAEIWQTDSQWGTIVILDLQDCTDYTFAVKARNQDAVETAFGSGSTLGTTLFGDLDNDTDVDIGDLSQLLGNYHAGTTYEEGDLDGDGDVDLADLSALLSTYGGTCP